ncbi:MAG: aldo/keto reductase, partial [Hyphomicrobiaceae bacterium]
KSPRGGRMPTYLNDRGRGILGALDAVAARLGAKPAQVALAWLRDRPAVTAPIASATSTAQLEELTTGIRLQLDKEAIQQLDTASV